METNGIYPLEFVLRKEKRKILRDFELKIGLSNAKQRKHLVIVKKKLIYQKTSLSSKSPIEIEENRILDRYKDLERKLKKKNKEYHL